MPVQFRPSLSSNLLAPDNDFANFLNADSYLSSHTGAGIIIFVIHCLKVK